MRGWMTHRTSTCQHLFTPLPLCSKANTKFKHRSGFVLSNSKITLTNLSSAFFMQWKFWILRVNCNFFSLQEEVFGTRDAVFFCILLSVQVKVLHAELTLVVG